MDGQMFVLNRGLYGRRYVALGMSGSKKQHGRYHQSIDPSIEKPSYAGGNIRLGELEEAVFNNEFATEPLNLIGQYVKFAQPGLIPRAVAHEKEPNSRGMHRRLLSHRESGADMIDLGPARGCNPGA